MAILRVKQGPNEGKYYELNKDSLTIGREPGDGIIIPDTGVSRKHAEVIAIGEVFFIRDLDSRNGTFVNDQAVQEEILRYGDRIRVGNTTLLFEDKLSYLQDTGRLIKDSALAGVNPSSTIQFSLTSVPGTAAHADVDTAEKRDLNLLFHIAHIIGEERNLSVIHQRVAELFGRNIEADHVYVLWTSRDGDKEFEIHGRYHANPDEIESDDTHGISRGIVKDCTTLQRATLTADASLDQQFSAMESVVANQLHSVMCVPITVLGKTLGALYTYSHRADAFSPEDLELASVIGIQLGTAVGLLNVVRNSDRFFRDSVGVIVSASEMRTPEARGNCERMATYSLAIGKELGFETHALRNTWLAGMLHNIGLIPMTDSERRQELTLETKKNHYARELLKRVPALEEILPGIESQNEHFDGTGAPEGKKGKEIPLLARILAVAGEFDHLLYGVSEIGEEMSIKAALLKIRDNAGKKFDPEVVKAMLIAYRKGRLFNQKEEFFEIPLTSE